MNTCTNTTANNHSCASPADILTVWYAVKPTVAIMTTYFDEDEFDVSPIKYDISLNKFDSFLNGTFSQYVYVNK